MSEKIIYIAALLLAVFALGLLIMLLGGLVFLAVDWFLTGVV